MGQRQVLGPRTIPATSRMSKIDVNVRSDSPPRSRAKVLNTNVWRAARRVAHVNDPTGLFHANRRGLRNKFIANVSPPDAGAPLSSLGQHDDLGRLANRGEDSGQATAVHSGVGKAPSVSRVLGGAPIASGR
jgi:hypothetical protein